MELTVKIEDKKMYKSLVQFLKSLGLAVLPEQKASKKKIKVDAITKLSEKVLAEEWNSKEDQAWDKVL